MVHIVSILYRMALRLGWQRGLARACRMVTYPLLAANLRAIGRDASTSAANEWTGAVGARSSDHEDADADVPAECVTIAGVRWWVPLDDRRTGSLSDRVLRGDLPMAEILRTHPFVRRGVMIDIGANIGTTSIPRLLLGEVERVYGAEPELANIACLRRTVVDNHLEGRIVADRVAIGDADGEAHLRVGPRMGGHRLVASPSTTRKAVRVPCLTLDTWIGRLGLDLDRVTYVKCDTQGWEGHVLAGASHLLRRKHVVWEMEICPGLLLAAGTELDDLCRVLAGEFRWFCDLRTSGRGMLSRPTVDLESAVRAAVGRDRTYTNVLLFNQR